MPSHTQRRPPALARLALVTALFAALPVAHADTDQALIDKLARQHYQQGPAVEAINDYELDGWNYIDPTHIVIHTGPSRHYLISLMSRCHDLSSAENIAFTTTTSKLTRYDKLIVRSPGGIRQDCPIQQINTLTKLPREN
jgi:hypothetical protein